MTMVEGSAPPAAQWPGRWVRVAGEGAGRQLEHRDHTPPTYLLLALDPQSPQHCGGSIGTTANRTTVLFETNRQHVLNMYAKARDAEAINGCPLLVNEVISAALALTDIATAAILAPSACTRAGVISLPVNTRAMNAELAIATELPACNFVNETGRALSLAPCFVACSLHFIALFYNGAYRGGLYHPFGGDWLSSSIECSTIAFANSLYSLPLPCGMSSHMNSKNFTFIAL